MQLLQNKTEQKTKQNKNKYNNSDGQHKYKQEIEEEGETAK